MQHGDCEVRQLLHPHPQHHGQGAGQHLYAMRICIIFSAFFLYDLELWFWSKSKLFLNIKFLFLRNIVNAQYRFSYLILTRHKIIVLGAYVKYGVRFPKLIWAPCAQLYSLADPSTPPPTIWTHTRGRCWSANIEDISLCPLARGLCLPTARS